MHSCRTDYYGLNGKKYSIKNIIGEGGEGIIYSLTDDDTIVAKIYKNKINTKEKYQKISAMNKLAPNGVKYTTWPRDLLFDGEKNFAGFIMKSITNRKKINEIYDTTAETYIGWKTRIAIANNLCIAVHEIHKLKQICGDFNPNNICIDLSEGGVLYLIDTDSFHIHYGGKTYRCSVGMTYYLPKEIQQRMKNESLGEMKLPTFTEYTDNFALAIHVFQLLMNGCHPYTMSKINLGDSTVCPPIEDNILNGRSAFFDNNSDYSIPIYAPPLDILPNEIQNLFKRAFVDSYTKGPSERPKAAEWASELGKLYSEIKVCQFNNKHTYYKKLDECPWCNIEKNIDSKLHGGSTFPIKVPIRKKEGNLVHSTNISSGTNVALNGHSGSTQDSRHWINSKTMSTQSPRPNNNLFDYFNGRKNPNDTTVNNQITTTNNSNNSSFYIPKKIIKNKVEYELNKVNSSKYATVVSYKGYEGYVRIPERLLTNEGNIEVKIIGNQAFRNCKTISTIYIPDTVVEIKNGAFYGCTSLRMIMGAKKVAVIHKDSFSGCHSLINKKLPGDPIIID